MPLRILLTGAVVSLLAVVSLEAIRSGGVMSQELIRQTVSAPSTDSAWQRDFFDQYCITCHNDRVRTAGLSLETVRFDHIGQVPEELAIWEKVVRKLRSQAMPPAGQRRPDSSSYDRVASWLEGELDAAFSVAPNPGRRIVHRLNRAEYTNAIRDLLGLEIDGREMLPADDSGYGFDNIADVLALSPSLLERYMIASARVAQLAVADPRMLPTLKTYRVRPTLLQYQRMSEKLSFGTRGGMAASHYFPLDGEYRLKIRLQRTHASQIRGLSEPNTIEVRFDRKWVTDFTVGGDGVINPWSAVMDASAYEQTADEGLELTLSVKAGTHTVGVSFPERRGLPEGPLEPRLSVASYEFAGDRDAPMSLESLSISGPYDASKPETTPVRSRIFVCTPDPATSLDAQERCATEILSTLARRAFRRPVTENDVASLLNFYREGHRVSGSFDDGIKRALRAVLVDPEFLFRIEREPDEVEPGSAYRLSPVELASRLSFFLWSSIPDDALLAAAVAADPSNSQWLRPQVDRMLRDPRAHALVENFAGQWLYLRNLPSVAPDPDAYPEFDENLRDAFRTETELFVESQLRNDRSLLELLTADYTFVNERLARHYGIPNIHGNYFRRVSLQDRTRFGLLGQGSILTATSYPNRTSPTLRGKWVLENLLGAPPPAPPANVPDLAESSAHAPRSVRERLEVHRANPVCASCHAPMDPLGLALEPFDAIGRFRTHDNGGVIDPSAELPNGVELRGPASVGEHVLAQGDQFVTAFTEKLLTYALGRGLEPYDGPTVRQIVRQSQPDQYRWSSVVLRAVESVPFQMRRSREP